MKIWRLTVNSRVLILIGATAALSTALALGVQDLALARDLESAAMARLDGSAEATRSLVVAHLRVQAERYRAISGTPQFRATLETEDAPTLHYYASQLGLQQHAALIAFFDSGNSLRAFAGAADLLDAAPDIREAELLLRDGRAFSATSVPLETAGRLLGRLVAIEKVAASEFEHWTDLVGAHVAVESVVNARTSFQRGVRESGGQELRVTASVDAEEGALARSRRTLLAAGSAALALALAAGFALSRGLVRPILEIQAATERIGAGDFDVRTPSERSDEIGDVARAFDAMLLRLRGSQAEVEANMSALRRSGERLEAAQRIAALGSWAFELERSELEGSMEFRAILGFHAGDKLTVDGVLARVHPEDRSALEEALVACLRDHIGLRIVHRIVLPDESERILNTQARLIRDDQGGLIRLEGTAQDVTERRRSEEQIRFLAYHDTLTGLGNRKMFSERLELAISHASRSATGVGVLVLDLDHFKRINDTLGHSAGDLLLRKLADRLVAAVRESDSTRSSSDSANGTIARFGGDEFSILLPDISDPRDLARVARGILNRLRPPFSTDSEEVVLTASIGITTWPDDGDGVDALLRNADAAMHHAKQHGRNNFQFFAISMNEAARERFSLETKLRRALERGELEIHYQPRIAASTGEIVSLEALSRWRDPEQGMISPAVFIPLAEELGLIDELTEWAMRSVCTQLAGWPRSGRGPVPVSVNLSAHTFRSGNAAELIAGIQRQTGVAPELLEIEITESALVHDEEAVAATLREIRSTGVRVALDDFGTGYSSLNYLRRLPVDILKIDRSFIVDIETDPDAAALTEAIIAMALALRLTVVAEGVETPGQWAQLERWHCDEIQGWVFSPAVPFSELGPLWAGAGPPSKNDTTDPKIDA